MPGNLSDNGMWPFHNIHKYSEESKRSCTRDCFGVSRQWNAKKKQNYPSSVMFMSSKVRLV